MNELFWTSVWLSVAIGVTIGYAITDQQIEANEKEAQQIEMTEFTTPAKSTKSSPYQGSAIKLNLEVVGGGDEDPMRPPLHSTGYASNPTPVEVHSSLVDAQHAVSERGGHEAMLP